MSITIDFPAPPDEGAGGDGFTAPLWVDAPAAPLLRDEVFGFDLGDRPVHRWKFWDAITGEVYYFAMNPNSMSSPYPSQHTISTGASPVTGMIGAIRSPKIAFEWTFSGLIRTQAFQDALTYWFAKDHKVYLTDHVGRRWIVMPESFGPYPRPNRRDDDGRLHRWAYDAKVINYGRQ